MQTQSTKPWGAGAGAVPDALLAMPYNALQYWLEVNCHVQESKLKRQALSTLLQPASPSGACPSQTMPVSRCPASPLGALDMASSTGSSRRKRQPLHFPSESPLQATAPLRPSQEEAAPCAQTLGWMSLTWPGLGSGGQGTFPGPTARPGQG